MFQTFAAERRVGIGFKVYAVPLNQTVRQNCFNQISAQYWSERGFQSTACTLGGNQTEQAGQFYK
jgi:hypothetical protein